MNLSFHILTITHSVFLEWSLNYCLFKTDANPGVIKYIGENLRYVSLSVKIPNMPQELA